MCPDQGSPGFSARLMNRISVPAAVLSGVGSQDDGDGRLPGGFFDAELLGLVAGEAVADELHGIHMVYDTRSRGIGVETK